MMNIKVKDNMSLKNKELTSITYLTLREYYAGLAMQGILASCPSGINLKECPFKDWAKSAIKQADALIAELEKSNG